jgi:hypothetical protein
MSIRILPLINSCFARACATAGIKQFAVVKVTKVVADGDVVELLLVGDILTFPAAGLLRSWLASDQHEGF